MIALGLICLLLGWLLPLHFLFIAGAVLLVVGAVLWIAGTERVGRRYY